MSTDDTLDFIAAASGIASLLLGAVDVIEHCIDQLRQPKVLLMAVCFVSSVVFVVCILLKLLLSQ